MRNSKLMRFVLGSTRNELKLTYVLCAVFAIIGASATQEVFGQTNSYIVMELPGSDLGKVASKLNNLGVVVGRAANDEQAETRVTVWNGASLRARHLSVLAGGDYSFGSDINDAGQIAGTSNTITGMLPIIWTSSAGLQRVPLIRGDSCGQATTINGQGHVAGYSSGRNGSRAFLWTRNGGTRNLGTLPGGKYSRARDVNDLDELAGTSDSPAGQRAVLWTKTGSICDLGVLPGDSKSEATAINNAGQVVGYSVGPRGMRAFVWTKGEGMHEITTGPNGTSSRALDISDAGDVVGSFTSASGDRAFKWNSSSGMTDLNTADSLKMGMLFIEAHAINSAGQILVLGEAAHQTHTGTDYSEDYPCAPAPPSTFLLTPAPAR
jgi:probable HAF family extracellular repeat protein